jgi:glycosyltransferase involved in cell wall biosynthesis
LAWMITRFHRVPWIAHVHGWLRQTHSGKHKIYENIDRYLIRGADLVLVGSSAMAEEVRLAGGRRVKIVTNGIPASDPALHDAQAMAIRARISPGGGLLVGILGRLHPGKGQALLIEALAGLRGKGLDITVVLMGEGPADAEYRALAQRLGIAAQVHFAGLVPETLPWLRAMDIVCVPSLKDSLPLTTLEAMSMARPIIASRAGDLPLAITDGRDGLLVDVGSASALEAAVERLACSPALREELGEAGRRTLIARYTPEAMLQQLEGYCAQLLAERRLAV